MFPVFCRPIGMDISEQEKSVQHVDENRDWDMT